MVDLSSGYGEAMVVRDGELRGRPGEIFALLGKNGMGKSTLLKTVMGFLPARTGRVRVFGEDITGVPPHRVARRAIAYTPQEQALFQDLTVEDNLRLGLRDDGLVRERLRPRRRDLPVPARAAGASGPAPCRAASRKCCWWRAR